MNLPNKLSVFVDIRKTTHSTLTPSLTCLKIPRTIKKGGFRLIDGITSLDWMRCTDDMLAHLPNTAPDPVFDYLEPNQCNNRTELHKLRRKHIY